MARSTIALLMTLALSSSLIMSCSASEFLKASPNMRSERVSEEAIRLTLLDEVENSLGTSAASRVSKIEATLRPIVAALPKNVHGNLERSAVSYALHRLFVARHGWVIKGLGAEAAKQNSSSPAGVLKDQVPAYIADLFEQRLEGKGFSLHELAILASTIEHLIHNEAVSKLGAVFNVLKLSLLNPLSQEQATEVLDTYFMAYILGQDLTNMTQASARQLNNAMPEIFLAWKDTQKFVDGIRKRIIKDGVDSVEFASLAKVVEIAGEEYGTFQDFECKDMKASLMKMEHRGTGRVRLSDFYKPALDGVWTFQESSGYLRSLGALDESDPQQPSVMMVNYIISPSNCIASSGFYSVCCKNECEGLLGHIEENLGAPEAKPVTIASLVGNLPSQTIAAPQKLSANLLQRLDDIAATHMGTVPLHSRLFAQWMHHVYPRECPYPHVSGTTDSKLPEEWMEASGDEGTATKEEMMQHVSRATNATDSSLQGDLPVEDIMPWSHEEEMCVLRPVNVDQQFLPTSSTSTALRGLALLAAACSFAYAAVQSLRSKSSLCGSGVFGNEKYLV